MQNKKVLWLILFVAVGCIVLFLVPALYQTVGMLAVGGVITSGILGGFSGKVGPVVGGKWKDKDYMRSHVIPANPQTAAQQANRGKMSQIVSIAKLILGSVIQTYWDPFYQSMSGYNAFVKANKELLAATTNYLVIGNKMTVGTLEPITLGYADYVAATGVITLGWSTNAGVGNALGTDIVAGVVFHKDGTLIGFDDQTETRDSESKLISCAQGYTPADLFAYAFCYRGTGSSFIVSNSSGCQGSVG